MYLSNDIARCNDALDLNCQWRHDCKRWVYRMPRDKKEVNYVVWSHFAKAVEPNKKCEHQLRID